MNISDDLIINNILFNKYNTLGKLCIHARKLKLLDNILKSNIPIQLIDHCRIGSINNNCLTIETSRSEYLTQLKFNTVELLSALRQHQEFSQIITIKYKVCPEFVMAPNAKKPEKVLDKTTTPLSNDSKNNLQQAIGTISDPKLKNALEKFLDTTTNLYE